MGATRAELEIFYQPTLERIVTGIKKTARWGGRDGKMSHHKTYSPASLGLIEQGQRRGRNITRGLQSSLCSIFADRRVTWSKSEWDNGDFHQWHVTRRSILLEEDKLQLSLPASKSDLFWRGVTITVAKAFDERCPVASMGNLFAKLPMPYSSPLFSRTGGKAFTCQYVTRVLRSAL